MTGSEESIILSASEKTRSDSKIKRIRATFKKDRDYKHVSVVPKPARGAHTMKRLLKPIRFLLAISFVLSAAVIAHADPLTLTSGSFTTFRAPGFWSNNGSAVGPRVLFAGGASGDCIGFCGPNILSSLLRPEARGATLSIDGQTFDAIVITFGFTDTTLTGTINVFANRNVPPGTAPVFSVDFVGHGFVTVDTNPELGSTLTVFTIATPEPASLLLIGFGITGLAVKLRGSRKHRSRADV